MLELACGQIAPLTAALQHADPLPLSASERRRLDGLRGAHLRQRFLASRWLLRTLLQQACGDSAAAWELGAEPGCAPTVLTQPEIRLSLAHSGDQLFAAVADRPLGVDLERERTGRDNAAIAALVCGEHELRTLADLPERARSDAFLACWTQKEAWLKRHARGLDIDLMQRIVLTPPHDTPPDTLSWRLAGAVLSLTASHLQGLRWHGPDAPLEEVARGHLRLV